MRLKYIPATITLIAGAIISILNMINKVNLTTSLKRLLLVLLIFYIIGLIARAIITKTMYMSSDAKDDSQEDTEDSKENDEATFEESNTDSISKIDGKKSALNKATTDN